VPFKITLSFLTFFRLTSMKISFSYKKFMMSKGKLLLIILALVFFEVNICKLRFDKLNFNNHWKYYKKEEYNLGDD